MSNIQHLTKLLKSDNPVNRINACEDLMALREPLPPEAIDALKFLTNDSHPSVANMAQRVLAIDTNEKKWGVRAADMRVVLFWIAFGVILSTVSLGAILGNIEPVSQKIVMTYHCPGAIHVTEKLGPLTQIGNDPNSFGQNLLGAICTFADGSTKELSSSEYLFTTMAGAVGLSAFLSMSILIVFTSIYIWWNKTRKVTKITEEVLLK